MLNILTRELDLKCLLNDDTDSNPLFYVFFCHLSCKLGNTSTKSSGLSPKTISRKIVDTDSPGPMIPAGGNSETILRLPRLPLLVFSTYLAARAASGASETTMFLVSGIKEQSLMPLFITFRSLCFFSGHDVWRRDFQVDEPTSLLDGACKGNPFAPSKRKVMKPPWDGVRGINVAQVFEF